MRFSKGCADDQELRDSVHDGALRRLRHLRGEGARHARAEMLAMNGAAAALIGASATLGSMLIPLWDWQLPDGLWAAILVFAVILFGCGCVALVIEMVAREYRVMDVGYSR
jgi:hypothetical protein